MMRSHKRGAILVCAVFLCNTLTLSQATVLVSDDFNRSASALSGSSPQTPANAVWRTNSNGQTTTETGTALTDGSSLVLTNPAQSLPDSNAENAFIPFTMAPTGLLTASVDADFTKGSGAGLGLSTGTAVNSDPLSNETPWMLMNDTDVRTWAGPGTNDQVSGGGQNITSGVHRLSITLDPATKTVKWFIDGDLIPQSASAGHADGSYTYLAMPTITGVVLSARAKTTSAQGAEDASDTFDNLLVTQAPEPSTIAFVGMAFGTMAFWRRRRC